MSVMQWGGDAQEYKWLVRSRLMLVGSECMYRSMLVPQ